ncbi:tripartite tricarboxylate transporter TctB family protein [Pseudochelatococcus sp. B33]
MQQRDYTDVIAGGVLALLGGAISLYAILLFPVGTVRQMGPGMFPAALGAILALLGLSIAAPAWFRSGELPEIAWKPLIVVFLSIAAFTILLEPFGVVPAVIVLTIGAVLADDEIGVVGCLLLAAGMSITTVILFQHILGVPFQAFRWPL